MNKIKEARQAAGLTQQQMSDQFEIPKRTIEAWETCDRKPPKYVEKLIVEKLEIIKRIRIKRGELIIGDYKPNKNSQTEIEEIISNEYFEKVQERMSSEKKETAEEKLRKAIDAVVDNQNKELRSKLLKRANEMKKLQEEVKP